MRAKGVKYTGPPRIGEEFLMRYSDPLSLFEFELPLGWGYDPWESNLHQARFRWWQDREELFGIQAFRTMAPPTASDEDWFQTLSREITSALIRPHTYLRRSGRTVAVGEAYVVEQGVYRRHLVIRGDALDLFLEHTQRSTGAGEMLNISPTLERVVSGLVLPAELSVLGEETAADEVLQTRERAITAAGQEDWPTAAAQARLVIEATRETVLRDILARREVYFLPIRLLIEAMLILWDAEGTDPSLPKMGEWIALRAMNSLRSADAGLRAEHGPHLQHYRQLAAQQEARLLNSEQQHIPPEVSAQPDSGMLSRRLASARWAVERSREFGQAGNASRELTCAEEAIAEYCTALTAPYVLIDKDFVEPLQKKGVTDPDVLGALAAAYARKTTLSELKDALTNLESLSFYGADAAREGEITGLVVAITREAAAPTSVTTKEGENISVVHRQDRLVLVEPLIHHAYAMLSVGDTPSLKDAQNALREAEELLDETGEEGALRVRWFLAAAKVAWTLDDRESASTYVEQGVRLGESLREPERLRQILVELREMAHIAQGKEPLPVAERTVEDDSSSYGRLRRANYLFNLAGGHINQGRPEEALATVRNGLALALSVSPFDEHVPKLLRVAGLSCLRSSEPMAHVGWYPALYTALDVLDVRRIRSSTEQAQISIGETPLASEIQDELIRGLAEAGVADLALEVADRARGRALEQALQQQHRQPTSPSLAGFTPEPPPPLLDLAPVHALFTATSYISRQCQTALQSIQADPLTSQDITALVDQIGATVLLIQPVSDKTLLLVARPGAETLARWSPIPLSVQKAAAESLLGKHQVYKAARGEAAAPTPAASSAEAPAPERLLWQALFEPLADIIEEGESLIVIPYREFSLIPFNLLEDSQGRMLVDRYVVSLAPSLASLRTLRQRGAWQRPFPKKVYLVGDPFLEGGVARQFNPPQLKMARVEVQNIKEQLERAGTLVENIQLRVGREAKEYAYRVEAPGSDLVHLACHGKMEADEPASRSFLALSRQQPHDGRLMASEVPDVPLDDALVFLSACQTGLGRPTADGVIGLGRAFLKAGARAVVLSLWKVSDRASARLVEHFYSALLNPALSQSATQALREALRRTRQDLAEGKILNSDGTPLSDKPAHWAPFLIVGDAEAIRYGGEKR